MSKDTWSKKKGLDLRWDKTKILKKELKKKGLKSKEIPVVQEPQVHKGKDNHLGVRRKCDHTDLADLADRDKFKRRLMRKLSRLGRIDDLNKRSKRLRKIQGMLYYYQLNNGCFTEQEADVIINAYMICREKSDPNHHPLQTSNVYGDRYKLSGSTLNYLLFSDATLRRALTKRGFFLNNGPFSAAESLTLMKNFEKFLQQHGRATDRESIWSLLSNDFHTFYHDTKMFTYIGKNLNRSTRQIYVRLFSLYHTYGAGKSNAKTDEYIMTRAAELDKNGVHKKHKQIGAELNRYSSFVQRRYCYLKNECKGPLISKPTRENFLKAIAEQQKCAIKDINPNNICLAEIAQKLGIQEEDLRSFWQKEGEKMCIRASLPKWRLEDSRALLKAIEDDEEEDENCIDFKSIHNRLFRGKVQNWEHLREHYNRVRRVVPYYMLKDLQSTVAASLKEIEKKMEKRGEGGGEGEGDGKVDENDDWAEDEDNFIE